MAGVKIALNVHKHDINKVLVRYVQPIQLPLACYFLSLAS